MPVEVGDYVVIGELGAGAEGRVLRVFSKKYRRDFAGKVVRHPTDECELPELQALLRLDHPNIIRAYDRISFSGYDMVVLELCAGGTLEEEIASHPEGIDPERAMAITHYLCMALGYMHDRGLSHRDVKPANILYRTEECRPCDVVLADFGLSQVVNGADVCDHSGTRFFYSPEVLSDQPFSPYAADMYALGVTIAWAVNGWCPFGDPRNEHELFKTVLSGSISLRDGMPEPVQAIIQRMTAWDPRQRPAPAKLAQEALLRDAADALACPLAEHGCSHLHGRRISPFASKVQGMSRARSLAAISRSAVPIIRPTATSIITLT